MKNPILAYFFILGLIFCFLIPPFQKPDETVHFQKTLFIAQGLFNCSSNSISTNKQFVNLVNNKKLQQIIAKKNQKLQSNLYVNQIFSNRFNRQSDKLNTAYICSFPLISYFPQAIGLATGKLITLNAYLSFFLGRLSGFLFFFLWLILLLKLIPKQMKNIILVVFGLPMTLHQLTAYNYDGAQIMFSLTLFTGLVKLLDSKWRSKNGLMLLIIGIVGFIFSRPIVSFTYKAVFQPTTRLNQLNNFWFFILMIIKTTFSRLIFYLQGTIGIFGWLEYGMDKIVYLLIFGYLIYLVLSFKLPKKLRLPVWLNFFIIIGLVAAYTGLLTFHFLYWTKLGSSISEGTQGRYFLPFLPFLLYWTIDTREKFFSRKIKFRLPLWLIYFGLLIIIISIIKSIILRFYIF